MSLACRHDGCHQGYLEYLVKHDPDGEARLGRREGRRVRQVGSHESMGDICTAGQYGDDVSRARRWPI
jgi:hypothetical protein